MPRFLEHVFFSPSALACTEYTAGYIQLAYIFQCLGYISSISSDIKLEILS